MQGNEIVFVTRPTEPSCNSCGRPTRVGFEARGDGSAVIFDCDPCARRAHGNKVVEAAIDADRARAFKKRPHM